MFDLDSRRNPGLYSQQPDCQPAQSLLPVETWIQVFDFLPLNDKFRFRCVCQLFADIVRHIKSTRLVVSVGAPLDMLQQFYSKNKVDARLDLLLTWDLMKFCRSILSTFCANLRKLTFVLLEELVDEIQLDVRLLPPQLQSLEINARSILLVNASAIQLTNIRRLILRNSWAQDPLYTFPNLETFKFSARNYACCTEYFETLSPTIRKLGYFDGFPGQICFFNLGLCFPAAEELDFYLHDSLMLPRVWGFPNLKRLNLFVTQLSPRYSTEPSEAFGNDLIQLEKYLRRSLHQIEVYLNGFRMINTPEEIPKIVNFWNHFANHSFQMPLTVNLDDNGRRMVNKALFKQIHVRRYDLDRQLGRLEKDLLTSLPTCHSLKISFPTPQSILDRLPYSFPHLCELNLKVNPQIVADDVGNTPTNFAPSFKCDLTFLLQLVSLQRLKLKDFEAKSLSSLWHAIDKLPFLMHAQVNLLNTNQFLIQYLIDEKIADKLRRRPALNYRDNRRTREEEGARPFPRFGVFRNYSISPPHS